MHTKKKHTPSIAPTNSLTEKTWITKNQRKKNLSLTFIHTNTQIIQFLYFDFAWVFDACDNCLCFFFWVFVCVQSIKRTIFSGIIWEGLFGVHDEKGKTLITPGWSRDLVHCDWCHFWFGLLCVYTYTSVCSNEKSQKSYKNVGRKPVTDTSRF